jgi:hypothetical protein
MTTYANQHSGVPALGAENKTLMATGRGGSSAKYSWSVGQHSGPEFVDAKGLRELFSISRTHAHRLAAMGLILSVSLCGRGKTRGRRLYSVASVRALLERTGDPVCGSPVEG